MELKYGCNPHQVYADATPIDPAKLPIELLNGKPSMINYLDATNAWQLVRELRLALDLPAAASFKHCSPAGAAVAVELDAELARAYEVVGRDLTPLACAYVRARGADPKSSFGDCRRIYRLSVTSHGWTNGRSELASAFQRRCSRVFRHVSTSSLCCRSTR